MDKPEALRLADELRAAPERSRTSFEVAAELRRLHAENERLSATVKAREDEILTHSEAFYEATRLLSKAREKNERLAAALASSCDEQRHELWESGGIAGCERARAAERQRDALLAEHQQTLALQQRSYEREIQLEVEAEREACAALLEANCMRCGEESLSRLILETNAAAIRARGNT